LNVITVLIVFIFFLASKGGQKM